MAIGSSQPFETNYQSVISKLAMANAQLTLDLAMANDQIDQYAAERDAKAEASIESPAPETA